MTSTYGPYSTEYYLLVVVGRYARILEGEVIRPTKPSIVILKLDKIFATHEIASIISIGQ